MPIKALVSRALSVGRICWQESLTTLKRPLRVLRVFSHGRIRSYLHFQRIRANAGQTWSKPDDNGGLAVRRVSTYESYVELQKMKLGYVDLSSHEARFQQELKARVEGLGVAAPGKTVVCLGARLGAEVRAFSDLGCFVVGVDLNPGQENRYVLYGDFHDLQFAASSVDVIYTNSLDHAMELSQVVVEMRRVLKPDGRVIVEADPGTEEADEVEPDLWQTLSWRRVDDLVAALETGGLRLVQRSPFEYPRGGEQLVMLAAGVDGSESD